MTKPKKPHYSRAQLLQRGVKVIGLYFREEAWMAMDELAEDSGQSRSEVVADLLGRAIQEKRQKEREQEEKEKKKKLSPLAVYSSRTFFIGTNPNPPRKRVLPMKNELSFNDVSELATNDPKSLGECAERIHQAFVGAGMKPLSVLWPHNLITTWSTEAEARQAMEFLKSCWVPNLNMFPIGDVWIVELDVSWLQKLCS